MKNILTKIKIHPVTYFFLFSFCVTGYIQMLVVLMLIIVIHEIGHLVVINYLKEKIIKIEFFPFGGMIKCEKDVNSSIKNEIILATSGILAQLVLGLILFLLFEIGLIRSQFYYLFYHYNVIIMLFNLLPIIPLDGYIILKSILEYFFPYQRSFYFSVVISFLILFVFMINYSALVVSNYLIFGFLVFKIWEAWKNFPYLKLRFFLERIMKKYDFKQIKLIKGININKMFKGRKHFFIVDKRMIDEGVILAKKFDDKP